MKELDERLQPILDRIPKEWGKWIDVGSGWYDIIINLNKAMAHLDNDYVIHQVKEKFGGLRFYYQTDSVKVFNAMEKLVREAEIKASVTCDVCGDPGKTTSKHGWYTTRCDKHAD